jgi:hypothetical protein
MGWVLFLKKMKASDNYNRQIETEINLLPLQKLFM